MELKTICFRCGLEKDIEAKGRRAYCRECTQTYMTTYYQKYRKRLLAYKREKYRKNPKEALALKAKYYRDNPRQQAGKLLYSYRRYDERRGFRGTLTLDEMVPIVAVPCHYCGGMDRIGLDRLDNSVGHTIKNCVPCCAECNRIRSNVYTPAEMRLIAPAIAAARKAAQGGT